MGQPMIRSHNLIELKRLAYVAVGFLALGTFLTSASSQPISPFRTAAEHAGMAAAAKQLPGIHQHLQHVLNCLEGSNGRDFKGVADNPCTDKGALQTLPKGSANFVRAEKAIALARVGVTLHDTLPAHYVAQAIHAILTEDLRH